MLNIFISTRLGMDVKAGNATGMSAGLLLLKQLKALEIEANVLVKFMMNRV